MNPFLETKTPSIDDVKYWQVREVRRPTNLANKIKEWTLLRESSPALSFKDLWFATNMNDTLFRYLCALWSVGWVVLGFIGFMKF